MVLNGILLAVRGEGRKSAHERKEGKHVLVVVDRWRDRKQVELNLNLERVFSQLWGQGELLKGRTKKGALGLLTSAVEVLREGRVCFVPG